MLSRMRLMPVSSGNMMVTSLLMSAMPMPPARHARRAQMSADEMPVCAREHAMRAHERA